MDTTRKSQAVINAEMQIALDNLEKDVQEILKILKGNGKVGLVERVNMIEINVSHINERHARNDARREEDQKAKREFWQKLSFWAITTILTNVGLIITIIIKFAEIYDKLP